MAGMAALQLAKRGTAALNRYAAEVNEATGGAIQSVLPQIKELSPDRPKTTAEFAEKLGNYQLSIPAFHYEWYDALDDDSSSRLLILAAREHAKTSVVLTWLLRMICEDRSIREGLLSQTGPIAKSFLRQIKRRLRFDERLHRLYGGPFYNAERWAMEEIIVYGSQQERDVSIFAYGTGAQVISRHCDILAFDDIETQKTVKTNTRREATRMWFGEITPLLSPKGKAVVIGSRKHFDDIYAHLLQEGSGWVLLDNALTPYENNAVSPVDEDVQPVWPDKWTKLGLERRKQELDATDIRTWPQEYENKPIAGEMQMFEPTSWPRYDLRPTDFLDDPAYTIVQGWDTAISEKQSSDFSCCVTIAVDVNKNIYILNVTRGHFSIDGVEAMLTEQYRIWRPHAAGIEENGFHSPIVQSWLQHVQFPLRGIKPPGDKVLHGRYLEARAAAGTVFVPNRPTPWWGDLARELLEFPAGAHDDQVDALSYALDIALPLSGWADHFDQESERIVAGSAPTTGAAAKALKSAVDQCELCHEPLGLIRKESTLVHGQYCSDTCRAFAETKPQFWAANAS